MTVTIDITALNAKLGQFQRALLGSGAGQDGMARLLSQEAGQLAWEIGNQLGPRTKAAAGKKLDADLKRSFYTASTKTNLAAEQQFSKYPAFTWLYASKPALVGFEDRLDAREETIEQLLQRHYTALKDKKKGWQNVGKRGGQQIMLVKKTMILQRQKATIRRLILARVGQSRASWARTAAELTPVKRIPKWVQDQITAVTANGKSVYNPTGLASRETPVLEFGSRAKGVETNDRMRTKINRAIKRREKIIADKVKKVLAGYTYDWNTGQVFRPPKADNS